MFLERLKKNYKENEPIFTEEVLSLFPEYSRVQVFRFLNKATASKEVVQFCRGVYYIPKMTFLGTASSILPDDIVKKKYISDGKQIYGIFGGLELLNRFSITTQMPMIIEIVTNKATMRYREITIGGRTFILRKSRCEINKDNFAAYTIMQLFSDFLRADKVDESSFRVLQKYIKKENITAGQIFALAKEFPARAAKNLIRSGIIDRFAQEQSNF